MWSPPASSPEAGENDCVVAVVRRDGNLIMILDFEKIIADINPELSMEKYDVTQIARSSSTIA